jgi:hypothetical protein
MPAAFYCDKTMEELAAESDDGDAFSQDITTTAVETIWHPVRLAEETSQTFAPSDKLRCDGGQPCLRSGYWWTPAREGSRRHFTQGEIMPEYPGSAYGATIWQWDASQG